MTAENMRLDKGGKIYSPGNIRALTELKGYAKAIDFWNDKGYSLRYSGGMVPDVYQLFVKGGGIFSYVGSKSHKAKLRYLYECAPFAFLIEKAGGKCHDGV